MSETPQQKRHRRRVIGWTLGGIALVLVLALVGAGIWVATLWRKVDKVSREDMLPSGTASGAGIASTAPKKPGTQDFVLMGNDTRGSGDAGRSDVLMLAHVNATKDKVYLVSFPRDMWVTVPGHGKAKINAADAWGGAKLTIETLQALTGVKADHAAQLDFEGFINLTNVLGGVTVNNTQASSVGNYHWPKGQVTLQGAEALAYVRQRHGLANGDLDRAARQRAVVQAVVAKLMSQQVLTDPAKLTGIVGDLSGFLTLDSSFDNSALVSTARSLKIRSAADIYSLQAPILRFGTSPDGQSIDVVDDDLMTDLATALQDDTMDAYYAAHHGDPLVTAP